MLAEVNCDKFRDKNIFFHNGLNVVLGDEKATNSIGKSTLLMIIDFVFGGSTFLEHNKDVIVELGHHHYQFKFIFEGEPLYFKRGTYTPDLIYKCDNNYMEKTPLTLSEYTSELKRLYSIDTFEMSFRTFVSLFSRVWGKENLEVKQPLHSFRKQKAADCIEYVIKLYEKYGSIKEIEENLSKLKNERASLRGAFKTNIIPKITKKRYTENIHEINKIDMEIESIKKDLAKFALNIQQISNREILELKESKDKLLSEKMILENKLNRIKNNLENNRHIKSKSFDTLKKFFPSINVARLENVENFHSKISNILKGELLKSQTELFQTLAMVNDQIAIIDSKISNAFINLENPNMIIDRVFNLSKTHKESTAENEYFALDSSLSSEISASTSEINNLRSQQLNLIQNVINDKLRSLVTKIYSIQRKSPSINFTTYNYEFELTDDTGTGKAFSNLILLDLAVFFTTKLPFIIHDSLLFKNIENDAVSNLISLYSTTTKQSFIALDEIRKYGLQAASIIESKRVLNLSDTHVLYIKDWRS
jgi:hypothetical protein